MNKKRKRQHSEQIKRPLLGNRDNYSLWQRKAGVNFKHLSEAWRSAKTSNSEYPTHTLSFKSYFSSVKLCSVVYHFSNFIQQQLRELPVQKKQKTKQNTLKQIPNNQNALSKFTLPLPVTYSHLTTQRTTKACDLFPLLARYVSYVFGHVWVCMSVTCLDNTWKLLCIVTFVFVCVP